MDFYPLHSQVAKKEKDLFSAFKIDGITPENYPAVDASTATAPLQTPIACKLLGMRYDWALAMDGTFTIYPWWEDIPAGFNYFERIKTSKTHDAILNLIDKKVDFILSARKMSEDEKQHAEEEGVTLIETPIAFGCFHFYRQSWKQDKSVNYQTNTGHLYGKYNQLERSRRK